MVYPPAAAVACLPLTVGRYATTLDIWFVLSAAAVLLAGLLSMAPWRRGLWPLFAALAAGLMVKSGALTATLWLGNLSLLLAPVAVGALLLFEARRWRLGMALLLLSLLLKPLLLPLIVIPLLRREWRPVVEAAAVGGVLLGLAVLLLPGGAHFFAVLQHVSGGVNTGAMALYDISIRGFAERLGVTAWGSAARVVLVALTAAIVYIWARRPSKPGGVAAMGTLLVLAGFIAGPVSEVHYLLIAAPCLLTAVALGGRPTIVVAALGFLALLMFAVPNDYIGNVAASPADAQVRYLLAELLLAGAAAAAAAQSIRSADTSGVCSPLATAHEAVD
jgi:hypothetical protein